MEYEAERAVRDAIAKLLLGEALTEENGDYELYADLIAEMQRACTEGGKDAARRVYETCARNSPEIAALRAADEDFPDHPSPLPAETTPDLQLGWIDTYADVMSALTGSPREFNITIALVVAATAIKRNARLPMSFVTIFANIYAAIIAPSSVYRKSTALNKARDVLIEADLENLVLSEHHTSEGLLRQLEEQPEGVVLGDEIGRVFGSHKIKYLLPLKQDLTALYDGYRIRRKLSAMEVKVDKPYLNILGATTPQRFYDNVTYADWQDGFLPRWLFALPAGEPDFDVETSLLTPAQKATVTELAKELTQVSQRKKTDFLFTGDAHAVWNEWQKASAKAAYDYGDEIVSAVVARYSTYALKIAMILAAMNGDWGQITPETMQTAMRMVDNYKVNVGRILEDAISFGVTGAKMQRIHEVVRTRDEGLGVTTKTILQYTRIPASELTPCLGKLLEEGALMERPASRGKRYAAVGARLPVRKWR